MRDQQSSGYPPLAQAWAMVIILFLAGVVSAVDRGVLNMVVDPIRHDLRISDLQISLLQGLAFGLFYAAVGLPLGLLVDRANRRLVLAGAVCIWSLATVMSGLAPNFGWMAASRVIMSVAEATLGPCALSLISDLFPAQRRGAPLSIHMLGGAIAGGVGVMLVGFILARASLGAFNLIPAFGRLSPWRLAFVLVGGLGLVVAALLLTQREPTRRSPLIGVASRSTARETLRYFRQNRAVFLPFYLAFALMGVASWACITWTATVLMRRYGLHPAAVGKLLGSASLVAGAAGALLGGQLIDFGAGRWGPLGKIKFLVFVPLIGLPAAMASFAPNGGVAAGMLAMMTLMFPMATTAVLSALSEMTPNTMHGVSVSLLGVASSFIGLTLGPLLVATVTEHVFHDPTKVGYSILIVAAPALLLSSAVYLFTTFALRRSLALNGTLAAVIGATDLKVRPTGFEGPAATPIN